MDPFVGEIRMTAFNFAPTGWFLCNGQLLAISQYQALFALLGTTYGGNGTSTFGLPNMQSRVPVHQGQGLGLSPYVMGEEGGVENVSLLTSQMPIHNHQFSSTGGASVNIMAGDGFATATSPTGNYLVNASDGSGTNYVSYAPAASAGTLSPLAGASINLGSGAIGTAGGSQPHENLTPYLVVNFIFAYTGIYPTRS